MSGLSMFIILEMSLFLVMSFFNVTVIPTSPNSDGLHHFFGGVHGTFHRFYKLN